MATTINIWQRFEAVVDGVTYHGGTQAPITVSAADDLVHDRTVSIADGDVGLLWNDGSRNTDLDREDTPDFDFMWILSDQDIGLHMYIQEAGFVTAARIKLLADQPIILCSNKGYDQAGLYTEYDIVDIWARNDSGNTARVRCVAIT